MTTVIGTPPADPSQSTDQSSYNLSAESQQALEAFTAATNNRCEDAETALSTLDEHLKDLTADNKEEELLAVLSELTEIWKALNETEQRDIKIKLYKVLSDNRPNCISEHQQGSWDELNEILSALTQDSSVEFIKDLKAALKSESSSRN